MIESANVESTVLESTVLESTVLESTLLESKGLHSEIIKSAAFCERLGSSRWSRGRKAEFGFTLIELMVALGLAAIISVSIMMISSQARMAYEETVKKVDVYNRFRYALRSIEEDLKNWIPTGELEFYQDGRGRGGKLNSHWDPGEEVQDTRDDLGAGVRDGGVFGEFDEFAFIEEGHYTSQEPGQTQVKRHDAYRMYFQTITYIGGAMRLANVEYSLADMTRPRQNGSPQRPTTVKPDGVSQLTLVKMVRYYDVSPDIILKQNITPVEREFVEVATNVTDFRLEYPVEPVLHRPRGRLVFVTPRAEYRKPVEEANRPEFNRTDRTYLKRFGYGSVKLDVNFPKAVAYPGARGDRNIGFSAGQHRPTTFGFRSNPRMQFAQLIPGSRIFVFTEANRAVQSAGGGAIGGNLVRFPAGDYIVKANMRGELQFEEDIDATDWNGENQSGVLYKAAYLPAAVRITMRVVDDRGENPKTLQRVVWIRRRSR